MKTTAQLRMSEDELTDFAQWLARGGAVRIEEFLADVRERRASRESPFQRVSPPKPKTLTNL